MNPDPDPGFDDQNCNKTQLKLQATGEAFSTSEDEYMNYILFIWAIFTLLDPDPDRDCESGYGSRHPTESGSNLDPDTDPDSQH